MTRAVAGGPEATFKYVEVLKPWCKLDHGHPQAEILLVLSGRGAFLIGDTPGEFRSGDLFVLGPRLRHTFFPAPGSREEIRALVIQFHLEAIRPALAAFPEFSGLASRLELARKGLIARGATRDTLARLMRSIGGYPPSSPRRLGIFFSLLAELGEGEELVPACGDGGPARVSGLDEKLDRACRLIQGNLLNPLSQAAVAGAIGMSPAAFSRWFKRRLGRPYTVYVNESRIEMACRALLESDQEVSRIGRDLGFPGERHFQRQFKARKGMSPSEYRLAARGARLQGAEGPARRASMKRPSTARTSSRVPSRPG